MIDITAKPFNLNAKQANWVKETLGGMTVEQKAAQTFFIVGFGMSDDALVALYKKMPYGGIMHRPGSADEIKARNDFLQARVDIPLLVAANLESGGSGIAPEGTTYSSQLGVAATGDANNAYTLGSICGAEARALGCNYAFSPVVDIDKNWRNPITNTRTYGSSADFVLKCGKEYIRGISQHSVAVAIKHFPGDGVDERDQHIVPSVNSLSCEEWDETYGRIYKGLIDEGAQTVMAGHILQPAYTRRYSPDIKDADIMPATLSPELITGLLRGKLGFNGMVITDAANMVGMCCMMERKKLVPACINAGCDMFLFGRNVLEDYQYMLDAVESGALSERRLDEAVTRILALKASIGLADGGPFTDDNYKAVVGCEEHRALAAKCADEAVTLVKDTQNLLPVSPEKYKRVLVYIMEDEGFIKGASCRDAVLEELRAAGFDAVYFDKEHKSIMDCAAPVSEYKEKYDLLLYFANIANASYQTVARARWSQPAAVDGPYLVKDIPTIFVSLSNPYHFVDVPMIRTIINGYTPSREVIHAVVEKLTGKSSFKGTSPVDPFCGDFWGKEI